MISFKKAQPSDAEMLARASQRAFHSDIHCGAPGPEPGGPPGYDSAAFQRKVMRFSDYFKIMVGDDIVGGFWLRRVAPREYVLDRIFLDPDYQNQGIGARAFAFLWETYPLAKRWTLGTPAWNVRTRHFYAKIGFSEIGTDDHGEILLERRISATDPIQQ